MASSSLTLPLVSIVTPTFNMGSWLPGCLESVRAQTYAAIEHIVIDGGSTDHTVALLEGSENLRWISEPDRGQADAINKGFRLSSGQLLGWLNADDELLPRTVERVVAALVENPSAGFFYGDIELVEGKSVRRESSGPYSVEGLWCGNTIHQPGTFWTREAFDRVGPLDESFHYTMDFELFLRFLHAGVPGIHIPEVLARFVIHEGSKTGGIGGAAFALDEARALRMHGEEQGAAIAVHRQFIHDTVCAVGEAAASGRHDDAVTQAIEGLRRIAPLKIKSRAFLQLATRAPRLAGRLYVRTRARAARR